MLYSPGHQHILNLNSRLKLQKNDDSNVQYKNLLQHYIMKKISGIRVHLKKPLSTKKLFYTQVHVYAI